MKIKITDQIWIDEKYIEMAFILSSGPGGQNVNKVATAVRLRFDLKACDTLPAKVKERLIVQRRGAITKDGSLIVTARGQRSQDQNRQVALNKLINMITTATIAPKQRKKSGIPKGEKRQRLEQKKRRSVLKSTRNKVDPSVD